MTVIDVKTIDGLDIAIVNADDVLLKDADTAAELFSMIRQQGSTPLIAINRDAFPTKFWDPATGFPHKVLSRLQDQECKMAVVGDFSPFAQSAFFDFMAECNNGFHLFFVADEDTAFKRLRNALADDERAGR